MRSYEVTFIIDPALEDAAKDTTVETAVSYTHLDVYKRQGLCP